MITDTLLPQFNTQDKFTYILGPSDVSIPKINIFSYALNADKLRNKRVALCSPKTFVNK